MNNKKAKIHLRRGAQIIMRDGLARGNYENYNGVCAVGAIGKSITGSAHSGAFKAQHLIGLFLIEPNVIIFNDKIADDAHDVASLLMGLAEEI